MNTISLLGKNNLSMQAVSISANSISVDTAFPKNSKEKEIELADIGINSRLYLSESIILSDLKNKCKNKSKGGVYLI